MSDIVWGEPIEVNGKRPEWLADGAYIQWDDCQKSLGWERWNTGRDSISADQQHWPTIGYIRLPADHPHYAKPDDWQPDERTVSEIAAYLEDQYPHSMSADYVRKRWGKPDPAKALVEEWLGRDFMKNLDSSLLLFTQHLLDTGRIKL